MFTYTWQMIKEGKIIHSGTREASFEKDGVHNRATLLEKVNEWNRLAALQANVCIYGHTWRYFAN